MAYIFKRRHTYYFRMAVPKDLRDLVQRREIIKSLHTHFYDQARQFARPLLWTVELLFAAARSGSMTKEEINKAIADFITSQERNGSLEFLNYSGKLDRRYYDLFAHQAVFSPEDTIPRYEYIRNLILSKLVNCNTSGMEEAAAKVFGIGPGAEGYAQACLALLAFDADQYKSLIEMARGDMTTYNAIRERYLGTPAPIASASRGPAADSSAKPAAAASTKRLKDVINLYTGRKNKEESWGTKTTYENSKNFDVILFVVDDVDIQRFEEEEFVQEVVSRFKRLPKNMNKKKEFKGLNIHQVLLIPDTEKLGPDRINKYLEYLRALLAFSIKAKWLTTNHLEGFKIKKPKGRKDSDERDAYDQDDLSRLLIGLQKVFDPAEPEKLWISTLMMFHGCRPADLVKMTKDQFVVKDGLLCMSVASKTEAGARTFPVHPFVLDCGFQRFLDTVPAAGKLWSDNLKFYEQKDADSHERWYNRTFEPKHVTAAAKKSLYSLRHTFITNLKHAEVERFLIKSIVGHEMDLPEKDITFDRYGKDYPMPKKLEALQALNFGVDLGPFKDFCAGIQWKPIR